MNTFKNEHTVKLSGVEILLRPTFENIEAVESNVGSVSYIGWKYSSLNKTLEQKVKSLPPATELAKIIFYSQAHRKEDGTPKLSLQEIWDLIIDNGIRKDLINDIVIFITKMTVGAKFLENEEKELAEETEKKT